VATRDYYNVLGVDRRASHDEIKRAYRELARRWHPDRNQQDAQAETRFKDISEAYRTLSEPERRTRYDRLGPLYTEDGRPPRPEDLNEVVGTVWSNLSLWRRRRGKRGEDLRYTASVSLEEVANGTSKQIEVPRFVRCDTCDGGGADPDGGSEECSVCRGTGRASGPRLFRTSCYHCSGAGRITTKRCPTCDGDGRRGLSDTLLVKVPAGVTTGQKLKISGKGNAGRHGSEEGGDLFVIVSVADHPLFRRRGDDVVVSLPLSFRELCLGAEVDVPTLESSTTIRIPPGSPPGKVLRLSGRGLTKVGRTQRGDLHVELDLELPAGLTQTATSELQAWDDGLPASAHPLRVQFDKHVQDRDR